MRLTLPAVICAAALVSCSDDGSVTAPADVNAHAAVGGMSQRSGAIVDRSALIAAWLGGGPPTNLAVQVALENTIEEFCANPPSLAISPQRGMVVITPSGKVPAHTVSGEAFAYVFEYSGGIVTDPCQQLVGAPVVATGKVFYSEVFNQFFGPGSGPGSYVVHITVHGIVDLTGGGKARLHGIANFVISPDGTLVKDQEPVTLKPL